MTQQEQQANPNLARRLASSSTLLIGALLGGILTGVIFLIREARLRARLNGGTSGPVSPNIYYSAANRLAPTAVSVTAPAGAFTAPGLAAAWKADVTLKPIAGFRRVAGSLAGVLAI